MKPLIVVWILVVTINSIKSKVQANVEARNTNVVLHKKREVIPQVYIAVQSDLPDEVAVGLDKRVIDSAVATAKVQHSHLNKKANLVQRKGEKINAGGLGEPADVLLEYQDSFGQYSFGYSAPDSARSEVRSSDGSTRGVFSYIDGSGVIQTAKYTADSINGFKIEASNLPQAPKPVEETPEVKAARLEHLRAYEAARKDAENQQLQASKQDDKIKQKLVKSSDQRNITDNKMEKQQTLTLNQLPQVNTLKRDQTSNVPFVQTSFILPSSNLNLQNRIDLKTTDLSSSTSTESIIQGKEDAMKKEVAEKDDSKSTQISKTQLHQLYSSPSIVSIPSYRIPVYSYNQRLQFIPSYYYY